MADISALKQANAQRWARAGVTRLGFASVAQRLCAAKPRYLAVQARTGVPWFVIAVIHERECSQNWGGSLAQGDAWNKVSVHVPKGRGPFASWDDAAVDALVNCSPYAARNHDWSIGGTLEKLEEYNGLGYANKGRPSPYIWSGTDQYTSGKYIRDGVYDPSVVDSQLGCAGLLKAMIEIDPTIKFGVVTIAQARVSPTKTVPVVPSPSVVPSITHPAPGSIGAWLANLVSEIFTHHK